MPKVNPEVGSVFVVIVISANNKVLKDDGSGKAYRIFKDDINEMWNSQWMQNIRQEFIDGKRPETDTRCS